jgi:hypothetical protein
MSIMLRFINDASSEWEKNEGTIVAFVLFLLEYLIFRIGQSLSYYLYVNGELKAEIKNVTIKASDFKRGVIMYSPMQMMFWYDKPSDWNGEKEIEFWEKLPVTWDESVGISGEIGKYAVIARRKDNDWFIGCINNEKARHVDIPLHFLLQRIPYLILIWKEQEEWQST